MWADEGKKTVLYLNSYHNGYQWSDGLLEGVRSVLNNSRYKVDFQVEYMDVKKFDYQQIAPRLLNLYQEKFAEENFDVIVISDNDALNFINRYRDILFPGVPVVFSGINDLQDHEIAAGNITGVVEIFDLAATLEVAKALHPERKRMVVLIDNSTAGRAIRRQVEKITDKQDFGLEVEFWIQLSLAEAQQRVRKLAKDSFLFIAPYYQTIDGHFYTSEEVSEAIYRHSSVPIYTAWEFMIGYGAVGGSVLSGNDHGQTAGEMALKILEGTKADDLPIIREPKGLFLFDHRVMSKLGISRTQLPLGSKVINEPKAIYSLSKELFWTIMISFILLLLALVSMLGAMFERRKVELKIIDQLAFQEALMDTIPQLVSWKDLDGKYLGANHAFINFFGTGSNEQLIGKTTGEIVKDKEYDHWSSAADTRVIETAAPLRRMRREVRAENGEENWLEVNKVPLRGQGGRLVGVLSTAENITKEQSLEKQLLQSQKLEAIGTLAGGISHDFNNILTSIINSTELALGDLKEDSQTATDLKRVLRAAKRGARLVQQILSFSRPSTEGFQPTDLSRVVQEVADLLEASTPANIRTVFSIEDQNPFLVMADPTQMHQAVLNLTTNAYQAMGKEGGTIAIILERLYGKEITPKHPEAKALESIKLSVVDSGPGIAPDIQHKIFDPFFSTKSKTEGTGLGLAVVHGIIESHQGSIGVVSEPGKGTVFEIILPATGQPLAASLGKKEESTSQGGKILFVEDDEDQLQTVPRLLGEMGFLVTPCKTASKAIALARSESFDLVLSDYDMPEMSGADLAAILHHLPFVLVSGRDDARQAALDHQNISSVIIKPYSREDLAKAILNHTD